MCYHGWWWGHGTGLGAREFHLNKGRLLGLMDMNTAFVDRRVAEAAEAFER